MQSRKYRFNQKDKKKWPIFLAVIVGSLLLLAPVIWIGLHNWNLDDSLSALNFEQKIDESEPNAPEPSDSTVATVDEGVEDPKQPQKPETPKETLPPKEPEKTETPVKTPDEPKESPSPPVEKPANDEYIPNQKYPTTPTIIEGFVIANKHYPLPTDYNKGEDPKAREAFNQMAAAAKLDGFELVAFSTFRSFERQETLYNQYVEKDGQQAADQYSARPGYSEHQTGLAFDIGEKNFEQHWASATFGKTPAGQWVANNAHKYGFILRYPFRERRNNRLYARVMAFPLCRSRTCYGYVYTQTDTGRIFRFIKVHKAEHKEEDSFLFFLF